jgi:hypothetical protein
MSDDVTWWQDPRHDNRNQNDQGTGNEIPGDTDAADIVGRTGEEMPEVAHDAGTGEYPDDAEGAQTEQVVPRKPDTPAR